MQVKQTALHGQLEKCDHFILEVVTSQILLRTFLIFYIGKESIFLNRFYKIYLKKQHNQPQRRQHHTRHTV